MVDQRVSLGFVGDVFEVMAQVYRRLTKVNTVDLPIRVNNSGRKPGVSQRVPAKGAPRHSRAAAARARALAKGRLGLDYTRAGYVGWVLGKVPEWLGRLRREHRRCTAAAATVSQRPSQAQGAACLRKEERVGLK
jgi:hypothetical protein